MNTLIVVAFAVLAAVSAKPSGHGGEFVLKGPSGIVTSHGPIGPTGPATGGDGKWAGDGGYYGGDDGYYGGDGGWDDGDDGSYHGEGAGGYSGVVHGNGATIIAPHAAAAVVAGPAAGHGGWGGWAGGAWGAGYGGYGAGYGAGYVGYGGHGVAIKGPKTVPAIVAGPAGKIVADGLYGVPLHH